MRPVIWVLDGRIGTQYFNCILEKFTDSLVNTGADLLLLDTTSPSRGFETIGGVMTKLIELNTTNFVKKAPTFTTYTSLSCARAVEC